MKSFVAICVLSFAISTSASPILGPIADTIFGTAANALNAVTGTASGLIGGALNAVGDVAKGAANIEFAKGHALQSAVNGVAGLGSGVLGTGALNGPGPMMGPGVPGSYVNIESNSRGYDNSASAASHSYEKTHTSFTDGPGGVQGTSLSASGQINNAHTRSMGYDDSNRFQAGYGY